MLFYNKHTRPKLRAGGKLLLRLEKKLSIRNSISFRAVTLPDVHTGSLNGFCTLYVFLYLLNLRNKLSIPVGCISYSCVSCIGSNCEVCLRLGCVR